MGNREPERSPPPSPEPELRTESRPCNFPALEAAKDHRASGSEQSCEEHPVSIVNGHAHMRVSAVTGPANGRPQAQVHEPESHQPNHSVGLIPVSFTTQASRLPAHSHTLGCCARKGTCDQQPREVTFQIVFHCVPENKEKEKRLTLKGYPESVLELKESIQAEYSIPASCQRVYFESLLIGDDERLDSYWIRDGDTLHV